MRVVANEDFLRWANAGGLILDPRYQHSLQLVFRDDPDRCRFWVPAGVPSDLPGFLATSITLASVSGPYWVRPRGGGRFIHGETASFREGLIDRALAAVAIGPDVWGALVFDRTDWGDLLFVATAFFTFGWSVRQDLEIIPEDRSCCLMLGHHGEMTVQFATAERLAEFVRGMEDKGYPLPSDVPDATFKRPEWMK